MPSHTIGSKVNTKYEWKTYTPAQVAQHNKEDDIWMIIHGKVYDVVNFLEDHPGGPEILHQHAGKDATQEFEETFHSKTARLQLADYVIGSVEGYTGPDDAATADKKKSSSNTAAGTKQAGGPNMVLIGVAVAVAALVAYNVLL
jgi:cytochrome b involved in lipid metabolism